MFAYMYTNYYSKKTIIYLSIDIYKEHLIITKPLKHNRAHYYYYLCICVYYLRFQPTFSNQTYPVMIYLHGGSYAVGGSSAYSANLLATGGVIVVTINYRLGMLGR